MSAFSLSSGRAEVYEQESLPPVPLKVVASFSILGDFVKQLGGHYVEVSIIVPENADPHVYDPKPLDVKKLNQADLVIVNGLNFEGWFDRLITNSGYKGEVIIAAATVKPRLLYNEQGQQVKDPHAWHDVKNALLYVQEIKKALQNKLPTYKAVLEARAHAYTSMLKELDEWVKNRFKKIPRFERKVLTTHDAFSYYGAAYGLDFLAPAGISTEAEPSAAKVAMLIKMIKEHHIKAIFIENFSFDRIVRQIAEEAKVSIGGNLFADSLSTPTDKNPSAKTYEEMIRHNTLTIQKKLLS